MERTYEAKPYKMKQNILDGHSHCPKGKINPFVIKHNILGNTAFLKCCLRADFPKRIKQKILKAIKD